MLSFRPLERSDLPFLLEVRNDCRAMLHDDRAISLEDATAWFDATKPRFFVIVQDDRPVGYFRTSNWDDQNGTVSIGCDIHRAYLGKGLARAAYPLFLDHLYNDLGMAKVSLEVLDHNEPAKKLYEALGFVTVGVKRGAVWRDGRPVDSIVMSLSKADFAASQAGER